MRKSGSDNAISKTNAERDEARLSRLKSNHLTCSGGGVGVGGGTREIFTSAAPWIYPLNNSPEKSRYGYPHSGGLSE